MSNQVVSTPREFLDVVERRFGEICWDLAANEDNHVTRDGRYFGPGSRYASDSLDASWRDLGLSWLNPPFAQIAAFSRRAAQEYRKTAGGILLIGPAAVCTGWFVEHVAPHAYVFELAPRVFKKEIRDCILAYYHPAQLVGRETWRWSEARAVGAKRGPA